MILRPDLNSLRNLLNFKREYRTWFAGDNYAKVRLRAQKPEQGPPAKPTRDTSSQNWESAMNKKFATNFSSFSDLFCSPYVGYRRWIESGTNPSMAASRMLGFVTFSVTCTVPSRHRVRKVQLEAHDLRPPLSVMNLLTVCRLLACRSSSTRAWGGESHWSHFRHQPRLRETLKKY